jgi:hypothetical protein
MFSPASPRSPAGSMTWPFHLSTVAPAEVQRDRAYFSRLHNSQHANKASTMSAQPANEV